MISVFIYKDDNDKGNWHWKDDGAERKDSLRCDGNVMIARRLYWYVRSKPIPSIVMPQGGVENISNFISSITNDGLEDKDYVSSMENFYSTMRGIIQNQCSEILGLNQANRDNVPLCVFIHFGGEDYPIYNLRLYEAWTRLGDNVKDKFLCFAITMNGQADNIINETWLKKVDGRRHLFLPDNKESLREGLERGCNVWGIQMSSLFKNDLEGVQNKTAAEAESSQPQKENPTDDRNSSVANTSNVKNAELINMESNNDQDKSVKIRLTPKDACVLKKAIFVELLLGFFLSWINCFCAHSSVVEVFFAVVGLLFVVIQVVVLLKSSEEADDAMVKNVEKEFKKRTLEAERFAEENELKADKKALREAYMTSPKAAKRLVAGITASNAESTPKKQ